VSTFTKEQADKIMDGIADSVSKSLNEMCNDLLKDVPEGKQDIARAEFSAMAITALDIVVYRNMKEFLKAAKDLTDQDGPIKVLAYKAVEEVIDATRCGIIGMVLTDMHNKTDKRPSPSRN
jgi:hypothetical protein